MNEDAACDNRWKAGRGFRGMFINVDSVQIKTLLVNNDTTKEIVNTLKVLKLGAGNHLQQNDYVSRFYIWFLHNINISFFF